MFEEQKTTDLESPTGVTLQDIIEFVQRDFLLIFSITFLASLIAILYSYSITPVFQTEVVAVSAGSDSSNNRALPSSVAGIASLAGIQIPSANEENIQTAIAVAESKKFNILFINTENLLPTLFQEDWNSTSKSWKNNEEPSDLAAFSAFSDHYNISYDTRDKIIRFTFNWDDPVIAANIANKFVKAVNKYTQTEVMNEAEKSINFLKNSLSKTSVVGIKTVLFSLIEDQTQKIMLANVRDDYTFKIIDPALPPIGRIKPVRSQIAIMGFIFGFILSLIVALIKEKFFTKTAA